MDREQKAAAVAELSESLRDAEAVFAVDYRGISVTQAAELRRSLAEADAVFKVVKNRLAKLAAAESGTEGIDELLVGPTALTLIKGDAVIAAKTISNFSRDNHVLEFKGGLMDGAALDPDSFQAIARLPGLEVLHGQLTGLAASPITGLVRGLGAMVSGLAVALGQIAEQGLVAGEAPAEEAPAEEAPADEAPADEAPEEPVAEPESEVPAQAEEAAAEDAPAEEAPPEQAEAPAEEQAEEVSDEEQSQPEEPAADAEAEGSEE